MILATYLPFFRINELENLHVVSRILRPSHIVICLDYVSNEALLRKVDIQGEYIVGNWQNRTSCLLRLVKYSVEHGDMLILDSDNLLDQNFVKIDNVLNFGVYALSDIEWRHARVKGPFEAEGVKYYKWKVYDSWTWRNPIFGGPKQGIRIKNPNTIDVGAVERVLKVFEELPPEVRRVIADEIPLGFVYYFSGINEVPFVVTTKHLGHKSHPPGSSQKIINFLRAYGLSRLYKKFGMWRGYLRYKIAEVWYRIYL